MAKKTTSEKASLKRLMGTALARMKTRRATSARSLARNGRVTAIDLDSKMLSVVQSVRRGSRAAVTRIVTEPLPTGDDRLDMDDPAAVGRWVRTALRRIKVRPVNVVMSVPRAKVILKPLILPQVADTRELASMVYYQLTKDLPFDAEDAIVDFTLESHYDPTAPFGSGEENPPENVEGVTEPSSSDDRLDVLATVVETAVVDDYRRLAETAGFSLRALGLRSYANARCVRLCEGIEPNRAVAVVLLRPDEVVIEVLIGDFLKFSRAASISGIAHAAEEAAETSDSVDADGDRTETNETFVDSEHEPITQEMILEAVAKEVERTLRIYAGSQVNRPIEKVLVGGDTGLEFLVATSLVDRLNLPGRLLDLSPTLELQAQDGKNAGAAIAAIGLALSANEAEGLPVNFLNPKRPPPSVNRARRTKVMLAAAVILVAIVGWSLHRRDLHRVRTDNANLLQMIEQKEKQQGSLQQYIRDEKLVREWIAGDRKWLDHWSYLSLILPSNADVYVTNITSLPNGQIRISLHAKSGEILGGLHEQLRDAGYDVSPSPVTPTEDRHGYGFRSTVELVVPAGMKPNLRDPKPEVDEEAGSATDDQAAAALANPRGGAR